LDSSVYFTMKALEYNPNDVGLYYNLGVTYYTAAVNAQKNGKQDLYKLYANKAQQYFEMFKRKKNKLGK